MPFITLCTNNSISQVDGNASKPFTQFCYLFLTIPHVKQYNNCVSKEKKKIYLFIFIKTSNVCE